MVLVSAQGLLVGLIMGDLPALAVRAKHLRAPQPAVTPAMHPDARQAPTMEGTRPSMVTRAAATKSPNSLVPGAPSDVELAG